MLKKFTGEPLLHFLLIGAAIFVLWEWLNKTEGGANIKETSATIVIDNAVLRKLKQTYQQHNMNGDTSFSAEGLISDYIRTEVLYREALKAGLDKDNDSIKTLLSGQMNAAYELAFDKDEIPTPTDEQLKQVFIENKENITDHSGQPYDTNTFPISLKQILTRKYFQREKKRHFEEKMKELEKKYHIIRKYNSPENQ